MTTPPAVNVTAGTNPLCLNNSTSLTASGAATYAWAPATGLSATSGSSVTANPTATTTYTVTGTSAQGCTASTTITLTVNGLQAVITPSATAICQGESVTLSGPVDPDGLATYTWAPANSGQVITISPSATTTFTLTVTKNGCSTTATQAITVRPLPTAGIQVLRINPNGTLTNVSYTPGQPLQYCQGSTFRISRTGLADAQTWQPGALTTQSIDITPVGNVTYTLTATRNACVNTNTISFVENLVPTFTVSTGPTVCVGGQAQLTANLTNAAFAATTFTWAPGNFPVTTSGQSVTTGPILSSATYTVTGTFNGCSVSQVVIVQANVISATLSVQNADACAGEQQIITATAPAGTNYLYQWTPFGQPSTPPSSTGSFTITPTTNTTVQLVITDGVCSRTINQQINVKPIPQISGTQGLTACAGTNAVKTISVTNGSTVVWSPATDLNTTTGTTVTLLNVPENFDRTYTVTATLNGCTNTATVTFKAYTNQVVEAGKSQLAYCGSNPVELFPTKGSSFTWNGPGLPTGGVTTDQLFVTPTVTSTYTYTGITNDGCVATNTITVEVTNPVAKAAANRDQICLGEFVTLNAFGSNADLAAGDVIAWQPELLDGGVISNGGFLYTTAPQTTTVYTLSVSKLGCAATATYEIIVNPLPQPTITAGLDVFCKGASTQLTVDNVPNAQDYQWIPTIGLSNNGIGQTVTASPENTVTYTVIATTQAGCTGTAQITLNILPAPVADIQGLKNSYCQSDNPVGFTVSPDPVGQGVVAKYFVNGTQVAQPTFSPSQFPVGSIVKIEYEYSNQPGCVARAERNVQIVGQTVSFGQIPQFICSNEGSIPLTNLQPSGGSLILNGVVQPGLFINPSSLPLNQPIVARYQVVTADGCISFADQQFVVVPSPEVGITTDRQPPYCGGRPVTLSATPLNPNYQYLWSNGAVSPTIQVTQSGEYFVTVTDVSNSARCQANSFRLRIEVQPLPPSVQPVVDGLDSLCAGESTLLRIPNANPGVYQYQWYRDGRPITDRGDQFIISVNQSGVYNVGVSTPQCPDQTIGDPALVRILPRPIARFTSNTQGQNNYEGDTVYAFLNEPVQFINQSIPDPSSNPLYPDTAYVWDFGTGERSKEKDPVYIFTDSQQRLITLWVFNTAGCADTAQKILRIVEPGNLLFPTAFSPNGTGPRENETFKYYYYSLRSLELSIYDRWHRQIWKSTTPGEFWDGRGRNGDLVPEGVYFYRAEGETLQGITVKKAGNVTVLR
jgi:hypothetical protein